MSLVSIHHLTRIFDVSKPPLQRVIQRQTRSFLTAVPDVSFEIEERSGNALVGEIPDPINPPPGYAYHPRCPIAEDICRRERPEMRPLRGAPVACHMAG
jgi:oligopeptide/dipeptide ABC transporter ATP-binding protein